MMFRWFETLGLAVAAATLAAVIGVAWPGAGADAGMAASGSEAANPTGLSEARLWPSAERLPVFPVRVADGARHVEDATGAPFLVNADVPGNILVQLSREDAILYLDDRRKRGFNTLMTGLIEKHFASNAPANHYGERPFLVDNDFSTPNDAYFEHVEWFLEEAGKRGFLVGMTPAWLGAGAGPEGWYREMVANGPERLRAYGRYLGRRFARFDNILWIHGGDYNPPDKSVVREIVEGIREFDTRSLNTVHCAPGTSGLDVWSGEDWLDLDTVYAYQDIDDALVRQYLNRDQLPFLMLESAFENEHGVDERGLRQQAWTALLTGAAGHVFGNNPVWHFDGPGLYEVAITWQEALPSRGAQSMTHLANLFSTIDWPSLVPDLEGRFLTGREGRDRAVGAIAPDGSTAVVYLPDGGPVSIDAGLLRDGARSLRWYDPATGSFAPVAEADRHADEADSIRLRPPGPNGAGFPDWVLVAGAS